MLLHSATTLIVLATTLSVAGAPGLSLKVNGAAVVDGVDNFKVTAIITNTGDETLKVLNDPLGPLSKLPTNTFAVTNAGGAPATFSGVKAKFVAKAAAAVGAFTVLAPGQSVQVDHNLGEAYNLTSTGAGVYEVEPRNLFYLVDAKGDVSTIRANVDQAHSARVQGKLGSSLKPTGTISRRATYVGCSAARQTSIVAAAAAAQTYALNAKNYVSSHTTSTTRYTTWFGALTTSRRSTVLSHYTAISGNTFSSFTYDCTCTDAGTYAFVNPDVFGDIHLCPVFWTAPTTGTDSKGGTLIHESSHFTVNGGTDDFVYGQASAKSLASSDPADAVFNADNHEYFAENNPVLA